MKINKLKLNDKNPRTIKNDRLKKLMNSIKEFPKMMELRPIIYDPLNMTILGGNMRYRALKELGYKEIPDEWVKSSDNLTEDEKQRFVIEDNVNFGDWDYDLLTDWDTSNLNDWGVDISENTDNKIKKEDLTPYHKSHILISFNPEDLLLIEKYIQEIEKISGIETEYSSN